jgi:hypothetical protein
VALCSDFKVSVAVFVIKAQKVKSRKPCITSPLAIPLPSCRVRPVQDTKDYGVLLRG